MAMTLRKAEEASLNGQGQDHYDTQQCHLLQEFVLSSPRSSPRLAATDENLENALNLERTIVGQVAAHLAAELNARQHQGDQSEHDEHIEEPSQTNPGAEVERANVEVVRPRPLLFRRDSQGRKRPFDPEGQEFHRQIPNLEQKHEAALKEYKHGTNMDDCTSSLTPTQANSDSLYAAYDIQNTIREQKPSHSQDAPSDDEENGTRTENGPELAVSRQQHSAVTDSTAFTYGEDDTGHVKFDFLQQPEQQNEEENHDDENAEVEDQEMDEELSQDASFKVRQPFHNQSFEPQTPAQPVNPFSHKGSVLKGHEMFGATQPSSIGRHIGSPTSSRPSPDVYNHSSPQKRITTSPLADRGDETALQSSVRKILRPKSADTPSRVEPSRTFSRSFDRRREPRDTYVSSKESQERREKAAVSPTNSDSDMESDTDIQTINRRLEQKRLAKIERQLAQVTSSRPGPGDSGDVEVPSTGRRRRSAQEEYLAQCKSLGGRDTQQEDVIIDSQAPVEEAEDVDLPDVVTAAAQLGPETKPNQSREIVGTSPKSSPKLPRVPDLYLNSTNEASSPPKDPGSPLQQQASIPLQEVSTNRNDLRTPAPKAHVMSDGTDTFPNTILETSPLRDDRIRPMGEIASLDYSGTYDSMVDDVPGFTQDVEFEDAIRPRLSPIPPSRPRARDTFPSFEQSAATAEAVTAPEHLSTSEAPYPEPTDVEPTTAATPVASATDPEPVAPAHNVTTSKTAAISIQTSKVDPSNKEKEKVPSEDIAQENPEEQGKDLARPNEVEADVALEAPLNGDEVETEDEEENGNAQGLEELDESRGRSEKGKAISKAVEKSSQVPVTKRGGLRTKEKLKGPSRALRRSDDISTPQLSTPKLPPSQRESSRVVKTTKVSSASSSKRVSDVPSVNSTPLSSLDSTPSLTRRSSSRKKAGQIAEVGNSTEATNSSKRQTATEARLAKEQTPVPAQPRVSRRATLQEQEVESPPSVPVKRFSKRKSGAVNLEDDEVAVTRSSKRQSTAQASRASSDDPLFLTASTLKAIPREKKSAGVFQRMAFAVSFVKQEKEKAHVSSLIVEQGGRLLEEGFDKLFEPASLSKSRVQANDEDVELTLSAIAKSAGFVALISDEHSRKAKYMQALALGLPCISGRWILDCVTKGESIDWTPYLLCAGKSSFLWDAIRSRTLTPYSATEASFPDTFSTREKLLDGKSILLVTGSGKSEETRRAYVFLTRALGPARVGQVVDTQQARKKLLEDDTWDMLYVDKNEEAAERAVFGAAGGGGGSKKRKRGPTAADKNADSPPKRIRLISDEVVIQSLILGQWL